ncbi:sigma factor-like helix-turn-helix DNA-binding protein [Microbacterium sp. UFMG61]|nr:sigma factor-like helix-turn-helix DNA-binding protein [Microbacterium sp. UFMG61]
MTAQEIGRQLGITPAAARQRISRARRALRG